MSQVKLSSQLHRPVDNDYDHTLGPQITGITLVEYGSYTCTHSRAANQLIAHGSIASAVLGVAIFWDGQRGRNGGPQVIRFGSCLFKHYSSLQRDSFWGHPSFHEKSL